ncbi:MAG: 4-(cytidine 5'-diphospho)-2-C-methyl-D-erythritol kinase [Clostridia bacterium]|nr:4-(cytidine 5'-diphospho)-2-C-methyl-D-erythritol kinase [Clostridia bacterium]
MKAYAKLNLYLNVNGRLPDGYHEITTVMQTVSLFDEVSVEKADGISVSIDAPHIPRDERNTAFRAAAGFFKACGIKGGASVKIIKNIPDGAGMAGGSADAAAALIQLNKLYGSPLSKKELLKVAFSVGADVPFCITGGTALCRGKGEIITPLKAIPACAFAIVKPLSPVGTPQAYAEYDRAGGVCPPPDAILEAIKSGNVRKLASGMGNALQKAASNICPQINDETERLKAFGALGAQMTGSGSAVFGVFENAKDAERAAAALKRDNNVTFWALPV